MGRVQTARCLLPAFLCARERDVWVRGRSWNLPSNFPEIKSWKNGKKSGVFSKLQQVLYNWIVFVLVKSYPVSPIRSLCIVKKALFLSFLRSVLMNYLITLSLEKKLLFWKKVLNFGSKYLYEACLILNVAYRNIFQHLWAFRQLFSNRNICVIVWTSIGATGLYSKPYWEINFW